MILFAENGHFLNYVFTQKVTQRYHGQFQVNETCSEFEENCQIVWFCENIAIEYVCLYLQYSIWDGVK